ncbi:RNA polymerase sigma factor [Parasphaerochaeta coccoides]|uniref:RNA polymerase, sigma-24 subunit, ECF subfamily n=1 Tax=Parasphaerochaeta coccoides (strain ATCC BAA-1237 / DSM 17374 / SPN1) TaxID=760011 RepID=F4GHS1_PARC1|nr:RNA polymerase sigma factor [Parasphaerochaeta coccoides]AEC01609.1 RNA polymerase, sigma-24 subunit, ECF subfamily [Parasphaerochaeta coccoides DSM 17374]
MEIKSSNEASFRLVYEQVFPVIMRVAYHISYNMDVAEDIAQETFIRFFDKNMDFATMDDARYWLIRVAKNLAINHVKRRSRERGALEQLKTIPVAPSIDGGDVMMADETKALVREAIANLPEKFRTVMVLKEYSGLDYRQIASVLQISESNVKVRVHRARKMMESLLDREDVHVP